MSNISHGTGEEFTDVKGAEVYAQQRHGIDGTLLLDPYFTDEIASYADGDVIDIGAGAGPWSALASEAGARTVIATDISMAMLEQAKSVASAHETVELAQSDGQALPFPDGIFGLAMSINVGCAMDSTRMARHLVEAERVLDDTGTLIVTAPTNLEIPFTTDSPDAQEQLEKAAELVGQIDPGKIPETFATDEYSELLRVTFAEVDGKWQLVYGDELELGQPVWRKLPGNLVVPNYYHNQEEYLQHILDAGFTRNRSIIFPTATPQEAQENGLSSEYCDSNPFAIFVVSK